MDDLLSIAVSNAVAATVLALAAIAVRAVYRRPALIHGLWLLVLLKLVTPPLLFIPIVWPTAEELSPPEVAAVWEEPAPLPSPTVEEAAAPIAVSPIDEGGTPSVEVPVIDAERSAPVSAVPQESSLWPQILRLIWGVGALAWFLLALERLHHFRRLLRFARPAPAVLQERTRRLASSLGLKCCPRVRLLPGRIAPMLWSVGGPPRLLVPADLVDVLSDEQLDTLLVHELAHLRRRDHWVRVLEFVVMGLYWWHPVVWYARRELHEAEEQCCDAWVVSILPGTGRTYASALLDTLDFLSTVQAAVPPLASGLGQVADLKRRLTMIMQGNTPRSLTWPGCLTVLALGLTCLPMLPSVRGEPPRKEDVREEIEQAEKALEKAKAALERQKANLEQKMKELDKAEKQMRLESARKALVELDKSRLQSQFGKFTKMATIRIEITIPADESKDTVDKIVQEIRKALPEELRNKVVLRTIPATPQPRPGQIVPSSERAMQGQPPSQPGPRSQPPIKDSRNDKRINDLEKKLEKVLRELQELRKQIRNNPPPAAAVPYGFVPPVGGRNPPFAPTPPVPGSPAPPAVPAPPPAASPPANTPQGRFRLLIKPPSGNNKPNTTPNENNDSLENPYYAPTLPLAPEKPARN